MLPSDRLAIGILLGLAVMVATRILVLVVSLVVAWK